ncbi:MAG: glutathione S-transferase family protein [Gammaproteobacteria bacterium]|nr:glutathione S-transferase family protein [Gammaproteobacteria bacterium]
MSVVDSTDCDLIFYTHPWSRGRIVRWMLEETGVPYRQVLLEYDTSMKAPDYLRINPLGKVPALMHRGTVITETAAICAYLADAFPEAGLAPALSDRANYYRWLFFAAGPLEAAITDRNLKVEVSAEQRRMVGYGTYEQTVDVLAQAVSAGPYLAGHRFSAADVYVGSHVMWGLQLGTLPKRPEFEEYVAPFPQRAAFAAAHAIDDALTQGSTPKVDSK